jgi:hypothetical protein
LLSAQPAAQYAIDVQLARALICGSYYTRFLPLVEDMFKLMWSAGQFTMQCCVFACHLLIQLPNTPLMYSWLGGKQTTQANHTNTAAVASLGFTVSTITL